MSIATDSTATDTWLELADAPAIDGLRFQRPRGNDAEYEALAEVIGASSRADDIPWFPSGAMLRSDWEDDHDGSNPALDTVVAEIDGRIVGLRAWDVVHGGPSSGSARSGRALELRAALAAAALHGMHLRSPGLFPDPQTGRSHARKARIEPFVAGVCAAGKDRAPNRALGDR